MNLVQKPILTLCEERLLEALYERKGRWVSYAELSMAVFGYPDSGRTLNTHVARIRAKLGKDAVQTYRGRGFSAGGLRRCECCQGAGWV